jgi:hypothetical protein
MERDISGVRTDVYHVFIASPGDVEVERKSVRDYFSHLNRTVAQAWGVQFQVVDWENHSTTGVGRPQELITSQILDRFHASLVLVVVIMAQRFGTPSDGRESGTEEEVQWALDSKAATGYPEVKFFFRHIPQFIAPPDPEKIFEAAKQWERVRDFRAELEATQSSLVGEYPDPASFAEVLKQDLDIWVNAPDRPWARTRAEAPREVPDEQYPPREYFQNLVSEYRWLDISGIDSDRVFKLPLKQIYVRLRVISGRDSEGDTAEESAAVSIQEALAANQQLVIVGDPGSGKSTFLRFIALTLAECVLSGDAFTAAEELSIDQPLPIPLYLSCWDLAEHLRQQRRANLDHLIEFVSERAHEAGWPISPADLEVALGTGRFIFLIDGLDEVPTEEGRHLASNLIEKFVAKYPRHRYVVTSRVRAYTGETVLGERFTRCDIQPFGAEERAAFLRNWVAQLFEVRDQADSDGAAASAELGALTNAIETSSIRSLATNPLLLTVIAIVHWNRKRLPERRVDLYDQCIDVLLGQRKQAEQQRVSRDTRYLHEENSRKRRYEQVWVRKRFAEIAFAILNLSDEEIGHAAVVELLEPHFRDTAGEAAREEAERFLEEQELRSGLLVHRQSRSYRFVHLTFQEYLAAWHLANRELADTLTVVRGHLRDPKWFETLQLLGGELANHSDEYLDRYISAILDEAGQGIREQAPVIALCVNIVRDTQAIAGLSATTQSRYEALVRATLDAFKPSSKVPGVIQLDLLEAFQAVGAPAKEQLIAATRSRLLEVRKRALEVLIPHLSDDDLFSMGHLLADRSKEPVKTYLNAIVDRDRVRAARLVLNFSLHGSKTIDVLLESSQPKLPGDPPVTWPYLVLRLRERLSWDTAINFIDHWDDNREATWQLIARLAQEGNVSAMLRLLESRESRETTRKLIADLNEAAVGRLAAQGIAHKIAGALRYLDDRGATGELVARLARYGDLQAILMILKDRGDRKATWELIAGLGDEAIARMIADLGVKQSVSLVSYPMKSKEQRELAERLARQGSAQAIYSLVEYYGDQATWALIASLDEAAIQRLAKRDDYSFEQMAIFRLVKYPGKREEIRELIFRLAEQGSEVAIRRFAAHYGDRGSREFITRLAQEGIGQAAESLAAHWGNRKETWELFERLAQRGDLQAVVSLIKHRGGRRDTWNLIKHLDDEAIGRMVEKWSDRAFHELVESVGRRKEAWELIERLAQHGNPQAVVSLIAEKGDREATWVLVEHLDDEALGRLVEGGYGRSILKLADHYGDREQTWSLIERLARHGSRHAVLSLVEHPGSREQTWELIGHLDDEAVARLAREESPYEIRSLVDHRGDGEQTWHLMERLARLGNGQAIVTLAAWRGDREETWSLIEHLAQDGVAEASYLLAWRDWALATAGPSALGPPSPPARRQVAGA